MFKRYREIPKDHQPEAAKWLVEEMCKVDGASDFIFAAREVLGLHGEKLVWFVGMIDNYHNHDDMLMPNLIRSRVHFKKIAMTKLGEQNYKEYRAWIKNWSDMLAICRYLDPSWAHEDVQQ